MKKKIIRMVTFVLLFAFLTGIFVKALPENTVEPANPLKQKTTQLKTDLASKNGSAGDTSEEENSQIGEDPEDTEEENESTEKEDPEDTEEENESTEKVDLEKEQEVSKDQEPERSEEGSDQETTGGEGQDGIKTEENQGKDEKGDLSTEGGKEDADHPGTGEQPGEDEHGLVTDLYDRILLFSEVKEDTLKFYAYYSDSDIDAEIKVNYKHKSDAGNGTWLRKSGERDYQTKLRLGQNYITIYYTDRNGDRNWTRITITYQADKASESNPVQGEKPPIIKTNLDDWTEDIQIYEFTFTVDAKKYDGSRIYNDCIQVWMDGKLLSNPTGTGIYEYLLKFGRPVEGTTQNHVISVLAWDDEGNSRFVKYQIRHKVNDEGDEIGTVTIEIDVTTLGLGIIDEAEIEVAAGDTAATAVLRMLDDYGYSYTNSGSLEKDFYLSSISRSDAFGGATIDERLRILIERDGISFLPDRGSDVLGEFDYTRGSGWMYFINSDYCPGKSMSGYTLNGGERISLRFTLAFGKDVGGSSNTGTVLSSYCAKWVNGTIIEFGHSYQEKERVEATKDVEGYILYVCEKCKDEKKETLMYEGPEEPEVPEMPEVPETPETPETPEVPETPEIPETPEVPEEPEVPDTPENPEEGEENEASSSKIFILCRNPADRCFFNRLFWKYESVCGTDD